GSFQKLTGMEGMGAVMTSSPCSPITGRPSGEKASTAQPRWRQLISPSHTGTSGDAPTNVVHTSVPPDTDCRWTDGSRASYTQRNPGAGRGEAWEPIPRRADRSTSAAGRRPSLRQAIRKEALVPK